jgi:hypothetical protein
MPKYLIEYYFNGYGNVKIKAENKLEAENKFDNGEDYEEDDEWGEEYIIEHIEELPLTK